MCVSKPRGPVLYVQQSSLRTPLRFMNILYIEESGKAEHYTHWPRDNDGVGQEPCCCLFLEQ